MFYSFFGGRYRPGMLNFEFSNDELSVAELDRLVASMLLNLDPADHEDDQADPDPE